MDTNIAVALWVLSERTDNARQLMELDSEWRSEAFLLVEFANVMATYVRGGYASESDALLRLVEAEQRLGPGLVLADHRSSLGTPIAYGVTVYDARFLVAASELGVPLVTEDRKLRRAAPTLTQSLHDALGARRRARERG